jgi:16S rRNA (uracil1498-N3)-methyltransferase
MTPRFFLEIPPESDEVTLSGPEAHHLSRVRRIPVGTKVELFDGRGGSYQSRVVHIARHEVTLRVLETLPTQPSSKSQLILGVSFPKSDRQRFLVEKCVELGVHTLVPLVTDFSVARMEAPGVRRWRNWGVEACKQCGRNLLMEIPAAMPLVDFLKEPAESTTRWIADPKGISPSKENPLHGPKPVYAAVGPEGGWSPQESILARSHGWQAIRIGEWTLRTETAAIAVASLCAWQELEQDRIAP